MSGPVVAGSAQVTVKLVEEAAETLGAAGSSGGSSSSLRLIVTSMVLLPPWPSSTRTVTS